MSVLTSVPQKSSRACLRHVAGTVPIGLGSAPARPGGEATLAVPRIADLLVLDPGESTVADARRPGLLRAARRPRSPHHFFPACLLNNVRLRGRLGE